MEVSALQWAVVGLVLIILEMLMGQFFVLFFGVSALLVALAKYLGVNNFALEAALFAVFGLLGAVLVRKKMLVLQKSKNVEPDLLQKFILSDDIPAGGEATIQYQGSPWRAENISGKNLAKGTQVQIVKVESIKLQIKQAE